MSSTLVNGFRLPAVKAFVFSLVCTLIFYFPSLEHHSNHAGFLYTGDVLGFYWPATMKMQKLISSLRFNTIDMGVFNGSSDFFVTPNFYGVHPLFIGYSLLFGATKPNQEAVGHALVWILAIQTFLGCFFAVRLAQRVLNLSFGASALAAVIFIFGFGTTSALGEPEFLFSVSVLPWCIYSAIRFQEKPSLLALPWAMLPTVIMLFGGYVPEGVATLFLATAVILYLTLTRDVNAPVESRVAKLVVTFVPMACAVLVVSPYLLEVLRFMKASPSAHTASLFYSAHQLAEPPFALLRLFSATFPVPGALYEMTVSWGLVGAYIALLFLLAPAAGRSLSSAEWTSLKLSFAVYALSALAIYGAYSPVSDMVFHFVPQVGGMHIYQRFLYPAGLLLGISMALMLTGLIRSQDEVAPRVGAAACLVLLFFMAYQVGFHPDAMAKLGLTNSTVFELILLALFACMLTVPGPGFKLTCAVFLAAMPTLNSMYNYEREGNDLADRRPQQQILLDPAMRDGIVNYIRLRSSKPLVKYMDLTPMWANGAEPFSKSFPYLVEDKIQLSSYSGFNFYLTPPAAYMDKMPIGAGLRMQPDWNYVRRTGADFVVAPNEDLPTLVKSGLIRDVAKEVLQLPGGVSMAPLAPDENVDAPLFDNGYFRVDPPQSPEPAMQNLAAGKPARQSSQFGDAVASRAVDGVTNGSFPAGSVSHTQADPNAWLDVDLGQAQPIDAVRLWNRTDCCGERLSRLWVLISSSPFVDGESADAARARPGVWSKYAPNAGAQLELRTPKAEGRYVRIQLDGAADPGGRYLSLAELQVLQRVGAAAATPKFAAPVVHSFSTNKGSRFALDLDAPSGARVSYELWKNRGLHFTVDGKTVQPVVDAGVTVIPVGPGRHVVQVRYRNLLQTVFWTIYFLFLAAVIITGGLWIRLGFRSVRDLRSGRFPFAAASPESANGG